MGYTEMTVLYNGCLEGDAQVFDHSGKLCDLKFDNALAAAQRFAFDNSDATVEIYLLEHPHEFGIDCECIQYVTDHNPYWKQEGKKNCCVCNILGRRTLSRWSAGLFQIF